MAHRFFRAYFLTIKYLRMVKQSYSEKLRNPKWQKKRLEILNRDEFTCQSCRDDESTLHVHHLTYKTGCEPWDYPNDNFITLCEYCHDWETNEMKPALDELNRVLKLKKFFAGDVKRLIDVFEENYNGYSVSEFIATIHHFIRNENFFSDVNSDLKNSLGINKKTDNPF